MQLFSVLVSTCLCISFANELNNQGAETNNLRNAVIEGLQSSIQVEETSMATSDYITVKLIENSLPNLQSEVLQAFQDGADLWSNVITTRLPQQTLPGNPTQTIRERCNVNPPDDFDGRIDNLLIIARVRDIDGRGGVLGSARICILIGGFARVGIMDFDAADVAALLRQNTFDNTVEHEMGHVLGLGTLWGPRSRNLVTSGNNPLYVGQNGNAGYAELGGSGSTPVENQGGAGTAGGHWRETVFGDEIMTGFLTGREQPLSIMTIRALEDLGYSVDTTQADGFVIPNAPSSGAIPMNDEVQGVDWEVDVDRDGRWTWFGFGNNASKAIPFSCGHVLLAIFNIFFVSMFST